MTCTTSESVVWTSSGGGLDDKIKISMWSEMSKSYLRPSVVDPNNSAFIQTIRISVLDIGDVPPNFLDTSEDWVG